MPIGEERLLSVADDALALPDVSGVEVVLMANDEALTRFAESTIHQNVARADGEARVRVVLSGGRVGVAATNVLQPDAVEAAARQAREAAQSAPANHEFAGLAPRASYEPAGVYDEATAQCSPAQRAAIVVDTVHELPRGVVVAGAVQTRCDEFAVVNTNGVRGYAIGTRAGLSVLASGADSSGYAEDVTQRVDDLDPHALVRDAVRKVELGAQPRDVDPGAYAVVLESGAVNTLISWLGYVAFPAKAVAEGRSVLCRRMNEQVCSPLVTIADDALSDALPGVPFDFEGTPKRRVAFIEGGVARAVAHDRTTAARAGTESTGHALPAPNPEGGIPLHLVMDAGTTSEEDLVSGVERGLYVTRFHYTNLVHPVTATLTGMTRDGTFLIEDGKLVGGVRNLRFTQPILAALETTQAVGRAARTATDLFFGASRAPSLRLGHFTFTSTTSF